MDCRLEKLNKIAAMMMSGVVAFRNMNWAKSDRITNDLIQVGLQPSNQLRAMGGKCQG